MNGYKGTLYIYMYNGILLSHKKGTELDHL